MDGDQLFHSSLHSVNAVMGHVRTEDLSRPTPCTDWDVRALMNHIANEVAWVEPLLQGKTIADVGATLDGDLLGDEPLESWRKYMIASMNAANKVNPQAIVHLSYGDKAADAYLDEVGGDVIIHGWDLARAIGARYVVDANTCAAVIEGTKDVMSLGRENGMVAKALPVGSDASAMEKLLAAYGRDINWKHDPHNVA